MKLNYYFFTLFICVITSFSLTATSCGGDDNKTPEWEWNDDEDDDDDGSEKMAKSRYIWVDAAANFPDFANSQDNIRRDLTLAKNAGFTHIVVDVRPTTGDVLYTTTKVDQVQWLGAWLTGGYTKVERTATWDYLQAFIDIGHDLDLKIYAGFNTFTGGNKTSLGTSGVLYRDAAKADWATQQLTTAGISSIMDDNSNGSKFFNPVNANVQEYLIGLIEDLAAYGDLDGIILDRGRFNDMNSDFSDYTKTKFEEYLGYQILNFPTDVMTPGTTTSNLPNPLPTYFKQWLEFRAKTIHDFMTNAQARVKAKNPEIDFGVYVGGWYGSYYDVGVNWASPQYNTAADYPAWASANYQKYGYADVMDLILIGAYASPTSIYGTNEWTVQGFCSKAYSKIRKDALVIGGPDVGNGAWATAGDAVVNAAITQSVDAAINACDGYFLFDMIHLKQKNQWQYVKTGIDNYLESLK